MQLDLEPQEVQSIINVLGELPTKVNAHPLLMKIIEQAKAQQESRAFSSGEGYKVPANGPHDGVPC